MNLRETIMHWHDPDAAKAEGHVCRIWDDLEVTITKSGSLLGQRREHTITDAVGPGMPLDYFPCRLGSYAFIYVSYDNVDEAYDAIFDARAEWCE